MAETYDHITQSVLKAETLPVKARFATTVRQLGFQMSFGAELRFLKQAMEINDDLTRCVPSSAAECLLTVASLGLSLNPALGYCYAVPWKVRKSDPLARVTPMVGYKGLVYLALEEQCVRWVQGRVVREGDEFDYSLGLKPDLIHKPKFKANLKRQIIAAYITFETNNGTKLFEVMEREELEKIRSASKAPDSPAWKFYEDQMDIKCVIRRASKVWKKSERFARAVHHDDKMMASEPRKALANCIRADQLHALEHAIGRSEAVRTKLLTAYAVDSLDQIPARQFSRALDHVHAAKA